MDRCTDVVELLVEHATDFRMCDLLDDNFTAAAAGGLAGASNKYNARKSGSDAVALGLIPGAYETIFIVSSWLCAQIIANESWGGGGEAEGNL